MITQTEKLRREKISKTIKEKYARGEWNTWNKGKKCPQLAYWKGKKNPELSKKLKGKPSWNKGLKGYLAGEKHYNWKGGKISESCKYHGSAEWKNWRKEVFQRDNYTCQFCYKRGVYLEAHHIKFSDQNPELRFEISNGLTLCKKCHKDYHRIYGKITLKNSANSGNSLKKDNPELSQSFWESVETLHGTLYK